MDKVICTLDQQEWTAEDFYALPVNELQSKKRNLKCIGCGGDAWFRRSSYGNESPHFCAHHLDSCSFRTLYEPIGEGIGDNGVPASDSDSGIVIDLDLTKSYDIKVKDSEELQESQPAGLSFTGEKDICDGGTKYPAHQTLKQLLLRLVRSNGRFYCDKKISIKSQNIRDLPDNGSDLFVEFVNVARWMDGVKRVFWGFISDAGQTQDGKIWLNAGNNKLGLSVCIHQDLAGSFLKHFKISNSLDELDGCHALIIGTCTYASTGKPVIRCGELNYIILRKYKSQP
ncbi:hypothetical protein ACLEEJ_09475 [Lonsdalea quercina]|uniref:hypothetical protein n=1 Tax=Lonsdalea quercina TaxID=71657 RepID=UPI00397482A8